MSPKIVKPDPAFAALSACDQARVRLKKLLQQPRELGAHVGDIQDLVIVLVDEIDKLKADLEKLRAQAKPDA